jgi:hypothetical protein
VKAFAIYTLLRLGLFITSYAVLAWLWVLAFGQDGMLLVPLIGAVIVSSLLSLKLLAPQRERFAAVIQARAERASSKFDEMRSREDEPTEQDAAPVEPVEPSQKDPGRGVA